MTARCVGVPGTCILVNWLLPRSGCRELLAQQSPVLLVEVRSLRLFTHLAPVSHLHALQVGIHVVRILESRSVLSRISLRWVYSSLLTGGSALDRTTFVH